MDLLWLGELTQAAYTSVLGLLCVYGLHRYFLVLTYWKVRASAPRPADTFEHLPHVTVQLPIFNELAVVERVIDASARIDYPADRLEIQVLDDSTDATTAAAQAAVDRWRARGVDIKLIHRIDRTGYKAGALANGLCTATGEYILIFDADFVPPAGLLRETIHHFTDPAIGMVQCRWDHLNRSDSALTRAQSVLLDGHFVIEHTARNRSGRYMSFNGTAGIWRKSAIEDAGGWQHDTLTEDLDLSYRAQLRGWKFVFRNDLTAPAELPPEMSAFKSQQHRWTKGGMQTCVKLLPRVLAGAGNWRIKLEAFFHLTSAAVYVLMVMLTLLVGPALLMRLVVPPTYGPWSIFIDAFLFFVATGSALAFYVISQRELQRSWLETLASIPLLMSLGIGIALNNAIAALEGFGGRSGEFVRTPKYGDAARRGPRPADKRRWIAWLELGLAVYLTIFAISFVFFDGWVERVSAAYPFLALFIVGYAYVSMQTLWPAAVNPPQPQAAPADPGPVLSPSES